jgi:hypothetical protein
MKVAAVLLLLRSVRTTTQLQPAARARFQPFPYALDLLLRQRLD